MFSILNWKYIPGVGSSLLLKVHRSVVRYGEQRICSVMQHIWQGPERARSIQAYTKQQRSRFKDR